MWSMSLVWGRSGRWSFGWSHAVLERSRLEVPTRANDRVPSPHQLLPAAAMADQAPGLRDLNRDQANPFSLGDEAESEMVGWFTPRRLSEF